MRIKFVVVVVVVKVSFFLVCLSGFLSVFLLAVHLFVPLPVDLLAFSLAEGICFSFYLDFKISVFHSITYLSGSSFLFVSPLILQLYCDVLPTEL